MKQFKIIYILLIVLILIKMNSKSYNNHYKFKKIDEIPSKININITHKSKSTKYNYEKNIIVKKDLFKNISYIPINESNFIIKTKKIFNETYFELCENKTLLDDTKYKRNKKPKISVIIPLYNKNKFSIYIPLRSIQNQSLKDIEIIFVDDGSS